MHWPSRQEGCMQWVYESTRNFVKKYGFQVLPLNQSCLCLFVTDLANSLSYKSINLYLCGVKYHAMAQGFRNCMQGMHQLHLTMRGIKRKLGVTGQRKPRMPISVVTLKQIGSYINSSYANKLDRTMFWAASALAFFGFLRSSEYTAPTVKSYHRKSTLQHSDITIERTRMIVMSKLRKQTPSEKAYLYLLLVQVLQCAQSGPSKNTIRLVLIWQAPCSVLRQVNILHGRWCKDQWRIHLKQII